MTIARTIGMGLGLIILVGVGVGVATLSRAQPAGEVAIPPAQEESELRERVIKPRIDVELLQLEYDAARVNLFEALKKAGERDLIGQGELSEIRSELESEFKRAMYVGLLVENKEMLEETVNQTIHALKPSDRAKAEEENGAYQAFLKGGQEGEAAMNRLTQRLLEARRESARSAIDRQKQAFTRKARSLNEKKLDLAEAEKQYQSEAR